MQNLIRKRGRISCVSRKGGSRKLSFRGCFLGGIFTALPYRDGTGILAKLATIRDASRISVRITPMPAPASPKAPKGFDYTSLDLETSQFVKQQTGEIRVLMKRTAQGIIEVGQKLIEVKEKLGHGYFLAWLEAEFEWSEPTAQRFMQVAQRFKAVNLMDLIIAPSALYELAAPSTPAPARAEALARAEAGESITYTAAKAIKQKYAAPPIRPKSEPKPEPEPQPELISQPQQPTLTQALPSQSDSKLEIVAIRPQSQASALEVATRDIVPQKAQTSLVPQPTQPVSKLDVPGTWWRLGGRHLLYCGDPNSPEFLARITNEVELVQLLIAFPSTVDWQPAIRARARLIVEQYLPQGKNLDQFDEILESNILFYSHLNDMVVSCFLPEPEIVSIVNRLERRGLFAEPDERCCKAVIADWKKAGLKVERLS